MRVRSSLLTLALLAIWMALPIVASADDEWALTPDDNPTAANIVTSIRSGRAYFGFETEDAAVPHNSSILSVLKGPVTFCINPSDASSGAATAQMTVWVVLGTSSTPSDNDSMIAVDAPLDGSGGSSGSQNGCTEQLPAARYYVKITTGSGAADGPYAVAIVTPSE